MTSRHAQGADHFDLLPFIAILMCTLGCLLLVTLAMAALSLGPGLAEGWVPDMAGSGKHQKTPILVEWDGDTAIIHRDGRRIRSGWSTYEDDGVTKALGEEPSPEIRDLLHWLIQHKHDHYALIAVRPSGFASLHLFGDLFRTRQIDVGSEPIDQDRAVTLVRPKQP